MAGVDSNPSLRRARFPRSDRSAGQGSSPASGDDAAQPRLRADGQLGDGERHRERPHGVERGPPRRGGRPARGVGRGAGRLAEREFPRLVAVRCHDPRQRGLEDEWTRGDGGLARRAPVRLAPLPAARPRPTLGRSALLLSGLGLPRGDDASHRPAGWSVGFGHLSLLPQQARDAGCDPRPHHGRPHPAQLCSRKSRSRPCRALHAPGRVPSAVPHPIATRWGSSGRARYAAWLPSRARGWPASGARSSAWSTSRFRTGLEAAPSSPNAPSKRLGRLSRCAPRSRSGTPRRDRPAPRMSRASMWSSPWTWSATSPPRVGGVPPHEAARKHGTSQHTPGTVMRSRILG